MVKFGKLKNCSKAIQELLPLKFEILRQSNTVANFGCRRYGLAIPPDRKSLSRL